MYDLELVEYKDDFIVIDKSSVNSFSFKFKSVKMFYIGYTVNQALKEFKKHLKGVFNNENNFKRVK